MNHYQAMFKLLFPAPKKLKQTVIAAHYICVQAGIKHGRSSKS